MKLYTTAFILLISGTRLWAQEANNRYKVPNNSNITKTIPAKDRFLLENFKKGQVFFVGGNKSEAPLNYSYFHSEIQFIDSKNDTLLLAESGLVSRVVIDDMVFYYVPDQGYVQLIAEAGPVRLARKQKLAMTDTEHRAAYGGYSSTSAISSFSTYTDANGQQQNLNSGTNVILRKVSTFFLIDQNQRFYPASKASLMKLLPKHKQQINTYFRENAVSFINEQDMLSLLNFCKSL